MEITGELRSVAKTPLSRLLDLVESGETVVIARQGIPVAELIAARKKLGLPFDIARNSPLVLSGDDWWGWLTDDELASWVEGD